MENINKRLIPAFEDRMIGGPFFSKKNRVFAFKDGSKTRVVKIFSEEFMERAESEYNILRACFEKGVKAPYPIECRGGAIVMSFIEGNNAGDMLDSYMAKRAALDIGGRAETRPNSGTVQSNEGENQSSSGMAQIIDGVADWLFKFHEAFDFRLIRGDSILRNFILSGKDIYGFDFEEAREGNPIEDVACAYAYILRAAPQFKEINFEVSNDLAKAYWRRLGKDGSGELPEAVACSLEFYAQFRKDGELLREWAEKIRKNGLAP